ncbi:MAG: alpha/beta hydrolase [Lachnospiraceae bacterium]|nr:alpha/beta hydrolase [Lachnospiraceae bacterium]
MAFNKIFKIVAAMVGIAAVAELGIAVYFYRRTMIRSNAKTDRTIKMAGTDWNQHMPFIQKRKEMMLAHPHEDQWIESFDGLKLHGTWFPQEECKKVVVCFHGYTSQGMKDYIGLSGYYLKNGYAMLLVDERAHGQSEGTHIGFGCLDRHDALKWINWVIEKCGENVEILLHGTSMGGATVLMTSGLELPKQVKGIVSDCAFTSPKEVFSHVLKSMYHIPAFPIMQIADFMNRKLSGYGLDECNAAREVKKAEVPILFIHGSGDTFVPCSMCETIYKNCASPKKKLIIEGAAHAESYYKDTKAYENALTEFIGGI